MPTFFIVIGVNTLLSRVHELLRKIKFWSEQPLPPKGELKSLDRPNCESRLFNYFLTVPMLHSYSGLGIASEALKKVMAQNSQSIDVGRAEAEVFLYQPYIKPQDIIRQRERDG